MLPGIATPKINGARCVNSACDERFPLSERELKLVFISLIIIVIAILLLHLELEA